MKMKYSLSSELGGCSAPAAFSVTCLALRRHFTDPGTERGVYAASVLGERASTIQLGRTSGVQSLKRRKRCAPIFLSRQHRQSEDLADIRGVLQAGCRFDGSSDQFASG